MKIAFKSPVLGRRNADPDGVVIGNDGISFWMNYGPNGPLGIVGGKGRAEVFVPWSNISYAIKQIEED